MLARSETLWAAFDAAANLTPDERADLRQFLDVLAANEAAGKMPPVPQSEADRLQLELWKSQTLVAPSTSIHENDGGDFDR